ncbi:MAG: PAS domain-containing protein, partial [Bacteroidales bacterium]|nr:PAS domain-containing protein [Bacteroidales bacterium]
LEKFAENFASTLALNQANDRMKAMLEQSREQARELQVQEERLRQNLEEMQATQEELQRQMEENRVMQHSLVKEKALLDAVMDSLPDFLYFKDLDSKFIRISKSMLPLFPYDTVEEMIGKSDFDFHQQESAQVFYDEEQEIIKSGKGYINKIVHELTKNGVDQWVSTTKMPLYDQTGTCIGTFGITKDITELKKRELEEKEMVEQLTSQKEMEKAVYERDKNMAIREVEFEIRENDLKTKIDELEKELTQLKIKRDNF